MVCRFNDSLLFLQYYTRKENKKLRVVHNMYLYLLPTGFPKCTCPPNYSFVSFGDIWDSTDVQTVLVRLAELYIKFNF